MSTPLSTATVEIRPTVDPSKASAEIKKQVGATDTEAVGKSLGEKLSNGLAGAVKGIGNKIGGEVGALANEVGEVIESIGEHTGSLSGKLLVTGTTIGALGVTLSTLGSKEKEAAAGLEQTFQGAGLDIADYRARLEETISTQQGYANSAVETQRALEIMVAKTGDAQFAFDREQLVADLAAQKHISLSKAATLVAAAYSGNQKIFKSYNIDLQDTGDKAADAEANLNKLAQVLDGQASASTDSFTGKLEVAKVKVLDFAGQLGAQVGDKITYFGGVVDAVGSIMQVGLVSRVTAATRNAFGLGTAVTEQTVVLSANTAAIGTNVAAREAEIAATTAATGATTANTGATAANTVAAGGARARLAGFLATTAGGLTVVGALTAAIGLGGFALSKYIERNKVATDVLKNASKVHEAFLNSFEEDGAVIGDSTKATVRAALEQSTLSEKAARSGITLNQLTAAVTGTDQQYQKLIQTWKDSGDPSDDTIFSLGLMRKNLLETQEQSEGLAGTTEELTATFADEHPVIAEVVDQFGLMREVMDRIGGLQRDLGDASNDYVSDLIELQERIAEGKTSYDDQTKAGIEADRQLRDLIGSTEEMALANFQAGGSSEYFKQNLEDGRQAILDSAGDNAELRDRLQELLDRYGLIPDQVVTEVIAETKAANAALGTLYAQIESISGPHYASITLSSADRSMSGDGLGANARGTSNWRGGRTKVGEEGEEIVDLPAGSKIYPASTSALMEGNGSDLSNADVVAAVEKNTAAIDRQTDVLASAAYGSAGELGRGLALTAGRGPLR